MMLSRQQQSKNESDSVAIVFVSSEVAPFSKTGGLGDVAGSLPQALAEVGCQVAVMTPKYGFISEEIRQSMTHICDFTVRLAWRNCWCGIDYLRFNDMDYYFIDNEDYFKRDTAYGYFDDGERFAFFSKAVCESLQHIARSVIDFRCDVLHCNDWQAALVPVFLGEFYQGIDFYRSIKTLFTVHNVKFQGQYSDYVLGDICGLANVPAAASQLRCDRESINYMQGALNYSDWLTTVSPTYAEELKTSYFGEGMEQIFSRRESVFSGILNGIDQDEFNPATDSFLTANYHVANMAGKALCKTQLQEEFSLEQDPNRPLMVMISRLTEQKGLDLVSYVLADILRQGVQVIVLGTGDSYYEDRLRSFEYEYSENMRLAARFDVALSHRMYAGADLFLMPSRFEPCGLSQIIAMRYGTLPVVRETGGLKDTVTPYNQYTGEGTGFSFAHYNGEELKDCVMSAVELYRTDQDNWRQLVISAMEKDFSWRRSALDYKRIYEHLAWLGRGYQPALV